MANTATKFETAIRPMVLAADPAIEPEGSFYYNSTLDVFRKSDGSAWTTVGGSGGTTQRTFAFFSS